MSAAYYRLKKYRRHQTSEVEAEVQDEVSTLRHEVSDSSVDNMHLELSVNRNLSSPPPLFTITENLDSNNYSEHLSNLLDSSMESFLSSSSSQNSLNTNINLI